MTTLARTLRIERDGPVLVLELHRPEAMNALDHALLDRLAAALRLAAVEPAVRAVILTGAGEVFATGPDLTAYPEAGSDAERAAYLTRYQREHLTPVVQRLRAIEKPVIAALNGLAAGTGLSLALACDLRLASTGAWLAPAWLDLGLIPDAGATALLPALIGLPRATELVFSGEPVDAARALELGLVSRVVPPAALRPAARELVRHLAARPAQALGLTKRAFNQAVLPHLAEQLAYEAAFQEIAAATADHAEALVARREGRPPRFRRQ